MPPSPFNLQKYFLPMVENPLDALFTHSQLQIRDNRNPVIKLQGQTIQASGMFGKFSTTVSLFQDFRFRYCSWTVCENGEEEDENDGAPLNTLFK